MGISRDHVSLSSALFSKVQQRVLALLFGNSELSLYTSEIVRRVRSGTGAVTRELSRLQRSGLIEVEQIGNQKHYRANRNSPVFNELRSLMLKTAGLAEPLAASLAPHAGKIKAAFVYGSVAKGAATAKSDVDLMVVGEGLSYQQLYADLQKAEQTLARPVNPTFLTPDEWRQKLARRNSFVDKINGQPKIFIFGSERDLDREQPGTR